MAITILTPQTGYYDAHYGYMAATNPDGASTFSNRAESASPVHAYRDVVILDSTYYVPGSSAGVVFGVKFEMAATIHFVQLFTVTSTTIVTTATMDLSVYTGDQTTDSLVAALCPSMNVSGSNTSSSVGLNQIAYVVEPGYCVGIAFDSSASANDITDGSFGYSLLYTPVL